MIAAWIVRVGQDREQLADALLASDRVWEWELGVNRVLVASTVSLPGDVASGTQLSNDAMSGPLGDPHTFAYVAQVDAGIVRNANQDAGMVCQESPVGFGAVGHQR